MPIKPIIHMFRNLSPANELKSDQISFNTDGSLTIQLLVLGVKNYKRHGFEVRIDGVSDKMVDPVL